MSLALRLQILFAVIAALLYVAVDSADYSGDGADYSGDGADYSGDGADYSGNGADYSGNGTDYSGDYNSSYYFSVIKKKFFWMGLADYTYFWLHWVCLFQK